MSTKDPKTLSNQEASPHSKDSAGEDSSSQLAVQAILKYLNRSIVNKHSHDGALRVLDVDCGNGASGICLSSKRAELLGDSLKDLQIHGLDFDDGMLDAARGAGVYHSLGTANLKQPLSGIEQESYDVVMYVSMPTKAHVGASILNNFVKVVRRGGGLVVVTIDDEIWESGGYKRVISDPLVKYGRVEVLGIQDFGAGQDQRVGRKMAVLRRKYLAEEIAHAGIGA